MQISRIPGASGELSGQTVAIAGNNAVVCHACVNENGSGVGKWTVPKIGVLQVRQKQVWSPLRTRAMP